MKNKLKISLLIGIWAVFTPVLSMAAYNASAVIGQVDHLGLPIFTGGETNSNFRDMGFQQNQGIIMDQINHRLYISDSVANRIMVFDLDNSNNLVDRVADHVLGQTSFLDFNSGLSDWQFNNPLGLAIDPVGQRLFVADAANFRVMIFDVASITDGEAAVNVLGQPDFISNTSVASQTGLVLPTGIEYDQANQRLFVADASGNRVMVYDVLSITNGQAATNVLGQPDFISSTAGSALNQLSFPQDIAYDPINDRLFVMNFNNGEIFVHDTSAITDGQPALDKFGSSDLIYTGVGGEAIEYDPDHMRLYASHTNRHRVLVYDVSTITTDETAVNVLGQPDLISTSDATTQSGFNGPERLYYQIGDDKLFVTDSLNNRIMVFDVNTIADGENAIDVIGQYTDGIPDFNTADAYDSSPSSVGLSTPTSIALDSDGHRLFVADTFNNRVLVYNLDAQNNPLDTIADFVLGQSSMDTNASGLSDNQFAFPRGLVFDPVTERLFVTDPNNNRVMVFDVATIVNDEAAINVLGQPDFITNTGDLSATGFNGPFDATMDIAGQRLFVLDNGNRRIMVFDVSSITDGQAAVNVLGSSDFISIAPFGTAINTINSGTGVAFDQNTKTLYVADESDARVIGFDTNIIIDGEDAVHVFGQPDFTTMGATVSDVGLAGPYGMDIDTNTNRLMIADNYASRVIYQNLDSISDGQPAANVLGQDDFISSASGTSQSLLAGPYDMVYDPTTNKVFVVDGGNARVLIYEYIKSQVPSLADGTVGVAYNENIFQTDGQGIGSNIVTVGALPAGINITANNFNGVPLLAGTYNFSIRGVDTLPTGTFSSLQTALSMDILPANGGGGGGGGGLSGAGGPYGHPSSEGGVTTGTSNSGQSGIGNTDGNISNSGSEEINIPTTDKCALRDIAGHPLEKIIKKYYALNVVEGRRPCLFFPDANMNRAEAVKVSLLGFGHEIGTEVAEQLFKDIDEERKKGAAWYLPYLSEGKQADVVDGYADGNFRPEKDVSLSELIKLYGRSGEWSEKGMSGDFYWKEAAGENIWKNWDKENNPVSRARALEILESLVKK